MNTNKISEIKRITSLAWQAFGRVSTTFKSKMPVLLKKKLYNYMVQKLIETKIRECVSNGTNTSDWKK